MQSLFYTIQINGFKTLLDGTSTQLSTEHSFASLPQNLFQGQGRTKSQDSRPVQYLKSTWHSPYRFFISPFTNLPFGICAIYFDLKVLPKLRILLCHPAGGRRTSLLHQGAESHGTRLVRQQRHRSAPLHVRCTENKTCSFGLDDFKVAWQRMIKKMSKVMTVNTGILI